VASIKRAYAAAGNAFDLQEITASNGIQGVYLAISATGGTTVVANGTLTQASNGWSYAAAPADKLVLVFLNGVTNTYTFTALQGNFNAPVADFSSSNHTMTFRFQNSTQADFTVTRNRSGGSVGGSLQGFFTADGTVFTANVSNTGTITQAVDQGYAETTHSEGVSGTVSGGTLNVNMAETRYWHYLYYNSVATQNFIRTINDSWTDGTLSYAMSNAEVRKALVNGAPGDFSYWVSQGALTRNGTQVGALGLTQGAVTIDIWLDVDGQRLVLESIAAR
jgi:hypothetical protein